MHEYIPMFWIHHAKKLPDGRIMPLEVLMEPVENRIAYIKVEKPEHERAVRLHAMRPVKGQLPEPVWAALSWFGKARDERDKARAELDKACAEYDKASAEWDKALAEWDKARAEYNKACAEWDKACAKWDKACAAHYSAIMALCAAECADVRWDENGLIF